MLISPQCIYSFYTYSTSLKASKIGYCFIDFVIVMTVTVLRLIVYRCLTAQRRGKDWNRIGLKHSKSNSCLWINILKTGNKKKTEAKKKLSQIFEKNVCFNKISQQKNVELSLYSESRLWIIIYGFENSLRIYKEIHNSD